MKPTPYTIDLVATVHLRISASSLDKNAAIDAAHDHALTLFPKDANVDIETEAVTNTTTGETTRYDEEEAE